MDNIFLSVSAVAVISVTFSACIFLLMSELAGKDAKIAEMEGEIRSRILEIAESTMAILIYFPGSAPSILISLSEEVLIPTFGKY